MDMHFFEMPSSLYSYCYLDFEFYSHNTYDCHHNNVHFTYSHHNLWLSSSSSKLFSTGWREEGAAAGAATAAPTTTNIITTAAAARLKFCHT